MHKLVTNSSQHVVIICGLEVYIAVLQRHCSHAFSAGNVRWPPSGRSGRQWSGRSGHATQGLRQTVRARLHLQLLVICACAHIALLSEHEVVADGRARE